jgi:hypothetical protein
VMRRRSSRLCRLGNSSGNEAGHSLENFPQRESGIYVSINRRKNFSVSLFVKNTKQPFMPLVNSVR